MNKKTIIEVMDEGGIRVPAIQRDYVMGRPDQETDKKLKESLEYFFKAAFDEVPDPLYFVYGMRSGTGTPLMLLDGQQRLTTLVLFAWFLDERKEIVKKWRFEYVTRRVADDFMKHLLEDTDLSIEDRKDPWRAIVRADWYLPAMESDATVASIHRVLDVMGRMFSTRGCPPLPDVREVMKRIDFSCEDMKSSEDDRSFDQIFLKMNARGLPLTEWEKMKSILDKHGDKDWKTNIDGIWSACLWEILGAEIAGLNCSMRKLVEMAIRRQFWDCEKANPCDKWLCDLIDMGVEFDEGQPPVEGRFWDDCKRYFKQAAGDFLKDRWSYNRSRNAMWKVGAEECHQDGEYRQFLKRATFSSLELLRFDLMTSAEFLGADDRSQRVVLNVLDSVSTVPRRKEEALCERIKHLLKDTESRLPVKIAELLSSVSEIADSVSESARQAFKPMINQLEQEVYKANECFAENDMLEIEKDMLVYRSQLDFLLWGTTPPMTYVVLKERLEDIRSRVNADWVTFFCNLLYNMKYNDSNRLYFTGKIPIPNAKLTNWGQALLCRDDMRLAIKKYYGEHEAFSDSPPWIKHLGELLRKDGRWGSISMQNDDWIYVHRHERWWPNSVRLDWSRTERRNREELLEDNKLITKADYFDASEKGVRGRSLDRFPGEIVYYDVNDKSWYEDRDPYEAPEPIRRERDGESEKE